METLVWYQPQTELNCFVVWWQQILNIHLNDYLGSISRIH